MDVIKSCVWKLENIYLMDIDIVSTEEMKNEKLKNSGAETGSDPDVTPAGTYGTSTNTRAYDGHIKRISFRAVVTLTGHWDST